MFDVLKELEMLAVPAFKLPDDKEIFKPLQEALDIKVGVKMPNGEVKECIPIKEVPEVGKVYITDCDNIRGVFTMMLGMREVLIEFALEKSIRVITRKGVIHGRAVVRDGKIADYHGVVPTELVLKAVEASKKALPEAIVEGFWYGCKTAPKVYEITLREVERP